MTKDNYNETKSKILEIIKENVEYQEQFLEIFILKAVMEKSYAELYAKLCKYLNKALPQKTEKNEKSSIFRDKLIKKCREIFKTKNFDIYIKEKEISEKEKEESDSEEESSEEEEEEKNNKKTGKNKKKEDSKKNN